MMHTKEATKKSFIALFTSILGFLAWALENAGWRCRSCATWDDHELYVWQERHWGTNIVDVYFDDPYYIEVTSCCCSACGHLMFERRKSLKKETSTIKTKGSTK